MWTSVEKDNGIHIIPINDSYKHGVLDCWCCPDVECGEIKDIITHKSFDKRELYEQNILKPH
jgi:hypothetical protein